MDIKPSNSFLDMRKFLIVFILLGLTSIVFAQKMSIGGNVQDTTTKAPLENAVAILFYRNQIHDLLCFQIQKITDH